MTLKIWLPIVAILVALLAVTQCQLAQKDTREAQAQTQAATAAVEAAHDAGQILDQGRTRDLQITVQSEKNRDAILKAPGADAPLDPGFVAAVNDGLCSYSSTPGCAELQLEHPAQLPPADQGSDPPHQGSPGGRGGE